MHAQNKGPTPPVLGVAAVPPPRPHRRAPRGGRSDWQVLGAWRAGDRTASELLLHRHIGPLRRFFRRRVKDPATVADLIAKTLQVCARAKERTPAAGAFRSLLYSSATNTLRRYFDQGPPRCRMRGGPTARRPDCDQSLWLPHTVRGLPLDQRAVFELSYLERLSGPQIAGLLGIPTATVYQHLRRSTQNLRAVMATLPVPAVVNRRACSEYAHDDHVMLAA